MKEGRGGMAEVCSKASQVVLENCTLAAVRDAAALVPPTNV